MKNINGNPIPKDCRDMDFLADQGAMDRYNNSNIKLVNIK